MAGAESRVRRSSSSPSRVMVRHCTGQMSMQASHSMHSVGGEHGLDVAVQAALHFARGLLGVEAELHFDVQLLEALDQIDVLHLLARRRIVVVVIAPLADPHLLADQVHALRRPLGDRNALAVVVNRDGRLVAVLHGPDDVLGPHAASPPKKTPGRVDCMVVSSTTGMSHLSNSMPRSRSIQGNAFSWPMARITSSAGRKTVSMTSRILRARRPIPGARTPCP